MGDRQNKGTGAGRGRAKRGSSRVPAPSPKAQGQQEKVQAPNRGQERGEGRGKSKGGAVGANAKSVDAPDSTRRGSRTTSKPVSATTPSRAAKSLVQMPEKAATSSVARAAKSTACTPHQKLGANSRSLDKVVVDVRLRAEELSQAVEQVNPLIDTLIREIKQHCMFKDIERLATGSYYEKVKISKPNEFDIMLKMPIERIALDQVDEGGAFYYVSFKRNPKEDPLSSCLDEDGRLSSSMMLKKLRSQIKEGVKYIKEKNVSVKRKKPGSPAVTLLIKNHDADISLDIVLALEVKQSWPSNTSDGLTINNWLGAKVRKDFRLKPFYLVPKCAKDGKVMKGETWRISFSHIEKDILNNHGKAKTCCEKDGQKCCRKTCLKLLKHLLESLKRNDKGKKLDKFCSYHVKTILFHAFARCPHDEEWNPDRLERCFQMVLDDFVVSLQKAQLPHFFIPSFNLFSPKLVDGSSLKCLLNQIADERDNGFPVFGESK